MYGCHRLNPAMIGRPPQIRPKVWGDLISKPAPRRPGPERLCAQLRAEDRADAKAAPAGVQLTVAIAVVTDQADILLVCRRHDDPDAITWQFSAGIVKPGAKPRTVAVRETLAEPASTARSSAT
ncbi:NUDIX hydrolase [Dactylosporangium sp. CS-047395]|uniref:NUDIX hydrolase n=1 Tax=Dactylosporangium sp. CS-047395 TaxID=3239936 RepID=UPI003D8FD2D4